MPRLLRLQYPVAIYHSLTHGDGQIDSVDPSIARLRDLVYGGEEFLKRIQSMAEGNDPDGSLSHSGWRTSDLDTAEWESAKGKLGLGICPVRVLGRIGPLSRAIRTGFVASFTDFTRE